MPSSASMPRMPGECHTASCRTVHVGQAAERLGIDERGLDLVDRQAMKLLVGRRTALGIKGIAAAIGLDLETFEEVHEPWLERSGLIERTPTMIHPPRPRSHS